MYQIIIEKLATPIIVGIVVGVIMYIFQERAEKREKQREAKTDKRDKIRDDVERVNREINAATMELSYATAIAVERGKTNGELKRAKAAYDNAIKHQNELGLELIKEVDHDGKGKGDN